MKYLYLVPLLFCASCSTMDYGNNGPQLTTINIIDRNGMSETISNPDRLKQYSNVDFLKQQPYQKVLQIYNRDEMGDIASFVTSYHPNGQPKQYLEVVNTRAFGNYKEWHQNGTLKLNATIIGGEPDISPSAAETWLFDGQALAWDEEGNLIADISYLKGNLHGDSIYYHANGKIWKKINYVSNEITGTFDLYLENGMLLQSTAFQSGEKEGNSVRYWECGRIASKEEYVDGRLMKATYYDIDSNIVCQITNGNGFKAVFGKEIISELDEYKEGIQEGIVKIFGSDQLVLRSHHIKNGIKHGEEIEYYDTPAIRNLPKLSINWHEGKIQGTVRTWYDNGMQESQREMSNNKKNGIASAWYRDGSLMMLEEYEQGKLTKGEYYRKKDRMPITTIELGEGVATMFDSEGNFVRKINYRSGIPLG